MIWGRAAHRCAFEGCRKWLEVDDGVVSEPSLIGQIAHLVAEEPNGPRGDSSLTPEQRDAYPNLILLCSEHHKFVDDHPDDYSVDRLRQMKEAHEGWVRSSLAGYDAVRQRDHEVYAKYIEEWSRQASFDNWDGWSSFIMGSGQPKIARDTYQQLCDLSTWLFRRVWPKQYLDLEKAFDEFRHVLSDFLKVFSEHLEDNPDMLWTRKFYQIEEWNPSRYERLSREWDFHVDLVLDLMLELTRAANRVCDYVRRYVDASYRLREGAVVAVTGDILGYRHIRAEYPDAGTSYPGLEQFKIDRRNRMPHYGEGRNVDDPEWKTAS
jgi:hypothetical protein